MPQVRRLLEVVLPLTEHSARQRLVWSYWRRRKWMLSLLALTPCSAATIRGSPLDCLL